MRIGAIKARAAYRRSFAERQTLAHPRGRVALEERGRGLPGSISHRAGALSALAQQRVELAIVDG